MHQVIPRPHQLSSSAPVASRPPRKSASVRSLRREKEKHSLSSSSDIYKPNYHDTSSDLPYSRPTYFDAHADANKPGPSRATQPSTREPPSLNPSPTTEEFRDSRMLRGTDQGAPYFSEFHYTLPTSTDPETSPLTHPHQPRPRTGPSPKTTYWLERSTGRRGSSTSIQYTETIPDTPSDSGSIKLFPAAPISGVETMDALVEGMNGGDDFSNGSRSGASPLYQPPLPTPPPGVVLGGPKTRKSKKLTSKSRKHSNDSGDDDDGVKLTVPITPRQKCPKELGPSRSGSSMTITPSSSLDFPQIRPRAAPVPVEKRASLAPSISDIIRAYAPAEGNTRRVPLSRNSSFTRSNAHAIVHEELESDGRLAIAEETDIASRSSYDSIADEVQKTLHNQIGMNAAPAPPPPSYLKRHSIMSDSASLTSPRSDGGGASICSSSIASSQPPLSPFDSIHLINSFKPSTPSNEVAQYLRSTRLTTLLRLTRSPHASHDNPLTISLSDLGSSSGYPVVVFLGLGCVRHIMGLYDEMAECLGLRLITIDRWGLGRTEPRAKSAKGIMQWASVVEEVLDMLHIEECSVMAHSAGSPYALSFASKLRKRIRGDICLLAPWVGGSESGGYKWLKYVPNGILKTAQAAEWKLQTWMIGKPPTIAWEGIGYDAQSKRNDNNPRPSMGSNFSEYDDLKDFDGRFESRSTLGVSQSRAGNDEGRAHAAVRKSSKGFLNRLKGTPISRPPSPPEVLPVGGKRLKGLRSMGSLKSKSSKKSLPPSPQLSLPPNLNGFEAGLGFADLKWPAPDAKSIDQRSISSSSTQYAKSGGYYPYGYNARAGGRRSISFTSSTSRPNVPSIFPPNPRSPDLTIEAHDTSSLKTGHQTTLGNALIAASHSESAKGTHNDLLQILNHDNHPWGFSYQSYPHNVRVWYGDKDEKIAENAVRWMEKTMGDAKCTVKVVKGADHGLMYNSGVVVEVLEYLLQYWQGNERR
ncbi:hypothetical protein E1B28_001270 [Marasmius oreades]|uniref:Alpha/beta-hydrolase n=1 Tax=Marasmius oreades TaxID=181124 RepID=A0A9P8AFC9_9AGAR|nr:uncharacterized protein E1B28_001270 [Marasmius oreades]KAG7099418.1 hypothetical protein E1B28_001270 [Marasmius oreades]